uniref:WD repeat- and FYVE domain-containing protein 4-like n=1 Tax=Sinocyclocheilus anshuiensis TaxID=1608454 RepID=A0A671PYY1_9TELE
FVEGLLETQELSSMIISLTLLWDQCSPSWRQQASRVLRAVSAAQAHNTVPALQGQQLHTQALVAVSVFSFVKDSYPVSPALFEEFENNDGYSIFQAILLRCEEQVTEEHFLAVQDLLGLIASFTLFGKAELKVAICVNNPQPPGFTFDPTLTNGSPVKNLTAFKIIQSSFLRSGNTVICGQILRTIQMIWSWEKANFFLLEWSLQSLAQLAECVWQKSAPVHLIFFELLETVIYQLSYIPHETIRKVQAVLKQGCSEAFNVAALDCFYGLIIHSGLLSEVLSDGGLMEQLLFELKRRAKIIRKAGVAGESFADNYERKLTTSILNVVAALALQSVRNTVFIRDLGMIPYVKIFLDVEQFRSPALCILEQLSEVNPEEYMSTAIGALCSSTESEIRLKQDLLQSIMKVLENPNSWNAFRTSGGFTGLLSIVVDMEGSLLEAPTGPWATLSRQSLVELLLLTLHTLALVVHVHPVNGHFFHTTGVCEKLADALMQLGCFQRGVPVETDKESSDCRTFQEFVEAVERPEPQLPPPLGDCVKLLGFLEQFATCVSLVADPCAGLHDNNDAGEIQRTGEPSNDDEALNHTRAASVSYVSTDSGRAYCDLTILHPGAVKLIMTLLPSIYCPSDPCLSEELQLAVAHHVQTLVKSERNRQIMCEFGLASTLLTHCKHILIDNSHSLHLPIVRILEKLASQSMDHKCLRQFLCLGDPLMCSGENRLSVSCEVTKDSVEDNRKSLKKAMKRSFSLLKTSSDSGTVVPLHRIISLVSITTPRSFQPHKVSISPSFVEFDMTDSGYGCLFLPSLATVKGVSADFISTGGLGTGFPPSAGLSFSCWFMICRFSSACESHPVRLLTIVRHMSRAEQQFSCLSVSISATDCCLVISTEEEPYQFLDEQIPSTLPSSVRFKCSKQLIPGQWHHLCLVMAKGIKKSCLVTVYLNATAIGIAKIKYIQPFPGQSISMDPSAVIDVCGIIGTPSLWKQHAALVWRVGPTYLFEEVLSSDQVETIYGQGTKYIGNYLALNAQGETDGAMSQIRMVSPERISFAINMAVSTITTVVDIRDQYNEVDCRLIAKEMGITSRDNCTPVFLAHNISQHLSGTARTIGAALVGCFGVRTFKSYSAASSFQYVGGPAAILSLVAMASDDRSLYAAIKVLLSVLETNPVMDQEMKRTNGYKLLSFLLKMKSKLISSRIFQLIMAIVGTMELGIFTVRIPNITAFQDIFCDFEVSFRLVWNFISSGSQQNAEVMHRLNMMSKLLILLHDNSVTRRKVSVICTIIRSLLEEHFNTTDIKSNQEEVFFALGSDWFLLFLQGHIHTSTVLLVLTLLTHFLSYPSILAKFREGVSPGTLVETMEMPTNITDNLKSRSWSFECLSCICPGFEVLQKLLVSHIHLPQVYGAISALLIGKSDFQVPAGQVEVTLPNCLICQNVLICNPVTGSADGWEVHYPGSVMQFLCLVNSLFPQEPLWTSPDFLSSLASAVFPFETPEVRLLGTVPFFCFSPDGVCQEHRQSFQTELLEFVMDIIHMTGQEEAAVLVENVAFFSKMVVEKLYSGMFVVEPENLLVFMAEQIAVALEKGHGHREITVSVLYKHLNRALLYFLSRPRQTPAEQELVVQTLRMLQQHWDVIMATYNANVHFIICLMHCLVLVRSGSFLEGFGCEVHKKPTRNIWRHIFLHKNNRVMSQTNVTDSAEGLFLFFYIYLLICLVLERRQALEEAYKIDLSAKSGSKEGQVSMGDVSPLWEETAMKAWQLFIGQSLLVCQHLRLLSAILFCSSCFSFVFYIVYLHISLKVHILCVPDPRILCEPTREVEEEHGLDYQHLTFFPVLNEATPLPEDFSEQCMDTQLILKELEPTEEVKAKHCVVVVSGHVLTEGVLLFGKADLYICEGFTLTSTGDVCCRIHHHTNVRDSYICNMMNKEKSSVSPSCKRWSYDDIKEANFMRFLLEDNALEIFLKNGTSVFLVFFNNDHVNAHKRKAAAAEKTALIKWQRGEISNFEYLMHLNTLAGRTYNDLMQYPVFPWIIADYESETLDLSHPATFRDLSKPMGAQNEKRKEKFIQRYNEVESNDGDLSAQCHYCTHYSSAIIVASYLVRMEPFSQTFLHLQGGMFDVPERMFHSIQNEWESASKDNMSDVRELIPEFFYLPDFLVNSNQFDFGCMQDGTPLDDVVLPPWAKGDPQEFIRVHREALESDYVSARLHLWIDLIFGYKQQGPHTVEALNTFHPYFYTDKHDRASMKDPVVKSTVLGYISNFGQMPKQLFTKPHPSRTPHKGTAGKETSVSSQITPFFFKLDKLKPSAQHDTLHKPAFLLFLYKELTLGPVGQIVCREKGVLVVEKNKLLIPPHWNTYFSWGSYDQACSFGSYTAEKVLCESLSDWGYAVCAACPNNSTIITAGTSTVVCVWDVSISKDKLKHMRLRQTLYGHTDTVTCLVASEAHSMIISGSLDQTCILWDLEDLSYITQLPEHSSAVSALAINDLTGEIVSCAGTHLNLWTMKGQLLASLNTSCRPEGNILCCCFTQKYEWDPRNVIITGSADGIVRVRPDLQNGLFRCSPEDSSSWKWERHLVLCQELNRNQVVSRRRCKNNPAITASLSDQNMI